MKSLFTRTKIALILWFLSIFIVFSTAGAVHAGTSLIVFAISLVSAAFALYTKLISKKAEAERREILDEGYLFLGWGYIGWFLLSLILLTSLQLIPLPHSILSILSPETALRYSQLSYESPNSSASFETLSISRGQTAFGLILLISFFLFYFFTITFFKRFKTTRLAYRGLVILGVLLVFFHFLGHLLNKTVFFGNMGSDSWGMIGLFINHNQASAIFGMLSFLALGGAVTSSGEKRGLWFLFYLLFSATLLLHLSRAGIAAWGIGHVCMILLHFLRIRERSKTVILTVTLAFIAIFILMGTFSAKTLVTVQDDFSQTQVFDDFVRTQTGETQARFEKTALYRDILKTSTHYPLGAGRQGFSDAFTAFQSKAFPKHFRHAENEYLEMLVEFGPFWGSFLIIFLLICLGFIVMKKSPKGHERGVDLGLTTALIFFALQNAFDFNARYFIGAYLALAYVGLITARWQWHKHTSQLKMDDEIGEPTSEKMRGRRRRSFIFGLSIVGFACIIVSFYLPNAVASYRDIPLKNFKAETAEISPTLSPSEWYLRHEKTLRNQIANAEIMRLFAFGFAMIGKNTQNNNSLEVAKRWYKFAIIANPNDALNYLGLGQVQRFLGEDEEAAASFARAASKDKKISSIAMGEAAKLKSEALPNALLSPYENALLLAAYLAEDYRYADMILVAENLERRDSDSLEAQIIYFRAYESMGFDEFAQDQLNKLRSSHSDDLRVVILFMQQLAREKKYPELFEWMNSRRKNFETDPGFILNDAISTVFYGQIYYAEAYQAKVEERLEALHPYILQNANMRAHYHWLRAEFNFKLGRLAKARNDLKSCFSASPNFLRAQKLQKALEKNK